MNAKQYLRQFQILQAQIAVKEDWGRRMRAKAESMAPPLPGMPAGQGSGEGCLGQAVGAYVDMEQDAAGEAGMLRDLRRHILSLLEALPDARYRAILEARYINGFSWTKIAGKMHYSQEYTYKLHRKALRDFQRVLDSLGQ